MFSANGFQLAQPVESAKDFIVSPNPSYLSPISMLGFLVFAIFAYGGIEVTGGLVDQTKDAHITFPKGVTIAAVVISIGYAIGIFTVGMFTNWSGALAGEGIHMGNVSYVIMNNLGYQIGLAFGLTEAFCVSLGNWVARYVGISMLLALTGAFFTLTYSPLKQMIEGTQKELWPDFISKTKDGIPQNAMWVQGVTVCFMIGMVSFGGDAAAEFFAKLVLMTNVAMTLPYMFISGAFIGFKKKTEIEKPFVVFKSTKFAIVVTVIVTLTVGFANLFTIIEPAMNGDISSTLYSIAGPLFFTAVANVLYGNYERKLKKAGKEKRDLQNA